MGGRSRSEEAVFFAMRTEESQRRVSWNLDVRRMGFGCRDPDVWYAKFRCHLVEEGLVSELSETELESGETEIEAQSPSQCEHWR